MTDIKQTAGTKGLVVGDVIIHTHKGLTLDCGTHREVSFKNKVILDVF